MEGAQAAIGPFQVGHYSSSSLPRPVHVDLPISAPGAFCYYIEHDPLVPGDRITGRKGYFNVDPIITLPARTPFFPAGSTSLLQDESSGAVLDRTTTLTLDSLTILSVLAKWIGKTDKWEEHFSEASKRGYNMLHWAPLQQRGSSGSPYSIYDQLTYDSAILLDPKAKDGGLAEIEGAVSLAREKYGLGGVTDVVLNHTAFDSLWLHEHPEAGKWSYGSSLMAGYSAHNTPHLAPAVELEDAMLELSAQLPQLGLPTELNSSSDLDKIVPHIKKAIEGKNLWQYYVFDVQASVKAVASAIEQGKITQWKGEPLAGKSFENLAQIVEDTPDFIQNFRAYSSRFGTTIDPSAAAGFIQSAYPNDSAVDLASKWGKVLDVINVDLYAECNDDINAAQEGVIGRLKFTRLDAHGPKYGAINKE